MNSAASGRLSEPRAAAHLAAPSNKARTTSSWSSPAHDEQHSTNTAKRSWALIEASLPAPISVETLRKCGIKGAHFEASRSQQPLNTETSSGSFADASPSS